MKWVFDIFLQDYMSTIRTILINTVQFTKPTNERSGGWGGGRMGYIDIKKGDEPTAHPSRSTWAYTWAVITSPLFSPLTNDLNSSGRRWCCPRAGLRASDTSRSIRSGPWPIPDWPRLTRKEKPRPREAVVFSVRVWSADPHRGQKAVNNVAQKVLQKKSIEECHLLLTEKIWLT